MSDTIVRATRAVDVVYESLPRLEHPDGVVRLVQFAHDSPGLRKIRRQVAESLILKLETKGFHLLNGFSEAVELLIANGYSVTPPVPQADENA